MPSLGGDGDSPPRGRRRASGRGVGLWRELAEPRVRAAGAVVGAQASKDRAWGTERNSVSFKSSSRIRRELAFDGGGPHRQVRHWTDQ
jgi:hypothetical protein